MSLQANVQLNLPKEFNTLVLEYNTYEKATFDQYLATSIAFRAKRERHINQYIDDITGKGSLNVHLKNLVKHVSQFDDDTLQKILDNSNFPITKIDKSNKYVFYPTFDIAVLNNRIYKDFKDCSMDEIKANLMIDCDLINVEVEPHSTHDRYDNYRVKFENDSVYIYIANKWIPIDNDRFIEYQFTLIFK